MVLLCIKPVFLPIPKPGLTKTAIKDISRYFCLTLLLNLAFCWFFITDYFCLSPQSLIKRWEIFLQKSIWSEKCWFHKITFLRKHILWHSFYWDITPTFVGWIWFSNLREQAFHYRASTSQIKSWNVQSPSSS